MSRRARMAVVALFFVVLGWLYIHTGRLPGGALELEFRLARDARAALAEHRYDEWARVDMDGRVAILSGIAPDEGARAGAIALVDQAVRGGGISRVVDETDLRMVASPYTFEARLAGDTLTLKGYAPDRGTRDAIAARAALAFAGQVDFAGIEIASGQPDGSDWLGAVDFAVAQLARLQEGVLRIEDASMTITGRAASRAVGVEVARQLRMGAPTPFNGQADIASPPPELTTQAAREEPAIDAAGVEVPAGDPAIPPGPADVASPPVRVPQTGGLGRAACQAGLDQLLQAGGENVRFGFNDAEVNVASQPLLNAVAGVARRCTRVELVIGGHTDATGDPLFNVYLSELRAMAVRDYLIGQGVDPSILTARGFGSSAPAASNADAAGRAQNRRIEIDVIEPAIAPATAPAPVPVTTPGEPNQ